MPRYCQQDCVDLSFPASEVAASHGIAVLSQQLIDSGVPASRAGDIKIALAEAINNVVEHAYAGVKREKVQIHCRICKEALEVQILDTGKPMPGLEPPDGSPPSIETPRQDLPEGGFGWFLILQLASKVRYEKQDGHNCLRLWFNFAVPR